MMAGQEEQVVEQLVDRGDIAGVLKLESTNTVFLDAVRSKRFDHVSCSCCHTKGLLRGSIPPTECCSEIHRDVSAIQTNHSHVCFDCADKCHRCQRFFCSTCLIPCAVCKAKECNDGCGLNCHGCFDWLCARHTFTCDLCEEEEDLAYGLYAEPLCPNCLACCEKCLKARCTAVHCPPCNRCHRYYCVKCEQNFHVCN